MIGKLLAGAVALGMATGSTDCWLYRDDIGSWWGIKGYEEQVVGVGTHKGHMSWPEYRHYGGFDSGSLRRGFYVFSANCNNCHSINFVKYDVLLGKAFEQMELSAFVAKNFTVHPAHFFFKGYYFQEWDERDRYIHDVMYSRYYSQDHATMANNGANPPDFTRIRLRPGGINYMYNLLTGYHYKAPQGMTVPKGKYFNPYYDHMILGMPRQLYDGLIDYPDGTPASTPQLANDVSNFVAFVQRKTGYTYVTKKRLSSMLVLGCILMIPLFYLRTLRFYRHLASVRHELYAVRDHLNYKHWTTGQKITYAPIFRGAYWL